MSIKAFIFFILAGFILLTGLLSVTEKRIFRAAIYLLFCMMGIAGLYFWMDFDFIAAVQVVVYVGGIVVLIIFSIFLTHQIGTDLEEPTRRRVNFATLAALFGFAFCFVTIREANLAGIGNNITELSVRDIGRQMLSLNEHGYILPFEVVSLLLLAAMIGCIVIAIKTPMPESGANQNLKT
ncbi:MAG TPA: NADH-quinone oxidoreductase subunit J [Chitinophagales bacterium]|nr:NADH-quinone oxidoreductase subunit J [Chitinophagales bacterium]